MLAALKLTLSPSIWPASCFAMSSQGSACAGAGLVEAAALSRLELAELTATAALQAGEAAAWLAEAGRIGAGRDRDQQGQRREPDQKRCLHDGLPMASLAASRIADRCGNH